ncbi:MAG: hypothetical protein ACT4UQ_11145 [Gammaproteobacteria bacterium]
MGRGAWIAACVVAWPAAGAETPAAPPDPEFLEFLAEFDGEDEAFLDYIESRRGEKELKRAEEKATKDDDDE